MQKLVKAVVVVAGATFVCGCPTTRTHYLAQPERVAERGVYVHPGSRITLPESVAGFQREAVLRYDAEGLDVSAAYENLGAEHPVTTTVYVYPSPSHVFIGSPPEVVASTQAHLAQNEFESRKQEILQADSGAKLIEQRDTTRTESGQSYSGKVAVFEYEDRDGFTGLKIAKRSELYLFCYVGGKWTVKYRFTRPKTVNADKEVQEFIQKLKWYGAGG
jgi:hypothetical protein